MSRVCGVDAHAPVSTREQRPRPGHGADSLIRINSEIHLCSAANLAPPFLSQRSYPPNRYDYLHGMDGCDFNLYVTAISAPPRDPAPRISCTVASEDGLLAFSPSERSEEGEKNSSWVVRVPGYTGVSDSQGLKTSCTTYACNGEGKML
ncbi:hypothetical protein EVAR_54073_1 [Eumeta japonica]|uniref:Uncharacterized protein n=1 Tax=Eumeta variegata TaxID=151549 RepID=A0A4C1XF40_EUMVA|nr:hypothetical protein EVAR_54073_1 [Eumeta japonica]